MSPNRVANTKSKGLAAEIGKKGPFQSATQEAYLNLIRTAAILSNQLERLFKTRGLSESTYNILRILRGVAALQGVAASKYGDPTTRQGLPLTEIGERMIAPVPDVTRLIDRLEQLTFATRRRCEKDRRVIYACITDAGLDVLREFDEAVLETHDAHLGHMSHQELDQMSALLEKARLSAPKRRNDGATKGTGDAR
jgi:DNA-binding MarR family transcriptional regulator